MRNILFISLLTLLLGSGSLRIVVLTTTPQMHCEKCEIKIKNNMRFEAGIKKIETSIERQEVTITYNPQKTDLKKIQTAMKKIGYDSKVVSDIEKITPRLPADKIRNQVVI